MQDKQNLMIPKKQLFVVKKNKNKNKNKSNQMKPLLNIQNQNSRQISFTKPNNNVDNNRNHLNENPLSKNHKDSKILLFEENKENNLFNRIRNMTTSSTSQINHNILFENSFINAKTSCYVTYFEELREQSNIINLKELIDNRKGFEEFIENYDWEYYELILILAAYKMNNDCFDINNSFIMSYLFDGMTKLKESNLLLNIKNNNKYCLDRFHMEYKKFCNKKKEDFTQNSIEQHIITPAIDESNFYYTTFIYSKLQKEKIIDFSEYKYNNITIQPLLNAIKFKESIIELNLSHNDIGNEGCYCLGSVLRLNKNLSVLILKSCKINNISLQYLILGLKYKTNKEKFELKKLDFSDNNITDEGGKFLGEILLHFDKLNWYNISNNKIHNTGAIDLLNSYKEALSGLDSSYTNTDIFAHAMNINSNNILNNINLSDNQSLSISNNNSINLNTNKTCHNLETLILYNIGIYSEECLKLLGSILINPLCGLKSLVLSQNNLGSPNPNNPNKDLKDVKYFLECLKKNKSVNELFFLNCQIGNEITQEIYKMLNINRTIEYLVLYNNNINDQEIFLDLLSLFSEFGDRNKVINCTMKVLDLSKNNCPIVINNKFLSIIEGLQLTSLDISQNELSREGHENFKTLANRIGDKLKIIY